MADLCSEPKARDSHGRRSIHVIAHQSHIFLNPLDDRDMAHSYAFELLKVVNDLSEAYAFEVKV